MNYFVYKGIILVLNVSGGMGSTVFCHERMILEVMLTTGYEIEIVVKQFRLIAMQCESNIYNPMQLILVVVVMHNWLQEDDGYQDRLT